MDRGDATSGEVQGDQEQEGLSASRKFHPAVFSKPVCELAATSHTERGDNKKSTHL